MNYRHLYHAGNFADVFKHLLLVKLLEKLRIKDSPFTILDTHAGIGLYDLDSENASKTGEYKEGIARLFAKTLPESPAFDGYLTLVKGVNNGELRYYPGSPCISRALLRPQDKLILAELHEEDARTLKRYFLRDKQVAVHHMDGYLAMKAFLPFKEKRGLVLIDPPFEKTGEFDGIAQSIEKAYYHFRQGIFAIWYPIKDRPPVQRFHNALLVTGIEKILAVELLVRPDTDASALNGCGMVVINPPWKMDSEAQEWLPALLAYLTEEDGAKVSVEWIRESS